MEMKEQIKENTPTSENRAEMKMPKEALPDEALEQVSGGMKILLGAEAAATKSYRGE